MARRVALVLPKLLLVKRLFEEEGYAFNDAMIEADRIARDDPDLCSKCASRLDSMGECPIGHED